MESNSSKSPPQVRDSLLIRLSGSDWADRRGQPVSVAMKLYWTVFTVVVGTGMYQHLTSPPDVADLDVPDAAMKEKMQEFRTRAASSSDH